MAKERPRASGRVGKTKGAGPGKRAAPRKLLRPKPPASKEKPVRTPRAASAPPGAGRASKAARAPLEPSPHEEAMEAYERGVRALQQRRYAEAAKFLQSMGYLPNATKEVHASVNHRVERQATPQEMKERIAQFEKAMREVGFENEATKRQLAAIKEEIVREENQIAESK